MNHAHAHWIVEALVDSPRGEYRDNLYVGASSPMGARLTALATWPAVSCILAVRPDLGFPELP